MTSPAPKSNPPPPSSDPVTPDAEPSWPAPDARPLLERGFRIQGEGGAYPVLVGTAGDVQLNATAAQILLRCDGQHSVKRLVAELEAWFDAEGIADEVTTFLRASRERGWLR